MRGEEGDRRRAGVPIEPQQRVVERQVLEFRTTAAGREERVRGGLEGVGVVTHGAVEVEHAVLDRRVAGRRRQTLQQLREAARLFVAELLVLDERLQIVGEVDLEADAAGEVLDGGIVPVGTEVLHVPVHLGALDRRAGADAVVERPGDAGGDGALTGLELIAHIELGGELGGRTGADDGDRTGDGVLAEIGGLRTAQHLDLTDIEESQALRLRVAEPDAIDVDRRGLVEAGVEAGSDAADEQGVVGAALPDVHGRDLDVIEALDGHLGELLAGDRRHRQCDVLQARITLGGGDDDLLEGLLLRPRCASGEEGQADSGGYRPERDGVLASCFGHRQVPPLDGNG